MKRQPHLNAEADESAALLNAALVLTLVGVLSNIESTSWVGSLILFILAIVAGVGGLILRYAEKG